MKEDRTEEKDKNRQEEKREKDIRKETEEARAKLQQDESQLFGDAEWPE